MPYTTERGVTVYSDRDTPAEYATSEDEDASRFNDARDRAYQFIEAATELLDDLHGSPIPDRVNEMRAITNDAAILLANISLLTKRP